MTICKCRTSPDPGGTPPLRECRRSVRRQLAGAVLACLLAAPSPSPATPGGGSAWQAVERIPFEDGHYAVLGSDRELYLEARLLEGEDLRRFAQRLCGNTAAATVIGRLRGPGTLETGERLRVPLRLTRIDHQRRVIRSLFPHDRRRADGWYHTVLDVEGNDGETLWRVARWLTGRGENAPVLERVNGLDDDGLRPGQELRVPTGLLLPALRYAPEDTGEPSPPGPLDFRLEDRGAVAVYRLDPEEDPERAAARFAEPRHRRRLAELAAEPAATSGDGDARRLEIPVAWLQPEWRTAARRWLEPPGAAAVVASAGSGDGWIAGTPGVAAERGGVMPAVAGGDGPGGGGVPGAVPAVGGDPYRLAGLAMLAADGGPGYPEDALHPLTHDDGLVASREIFEVEYTIVAGGKVLDGPQALLHRRRDVLLLPLRPLAAALGHHLTFHAAKLRVEVEREPDGARITLDLNSGTVTVDDRPVGVAPDVDLATVAGLMVPVDAAEALTGATVTVDHDAREIRAELDERLRSVFGFEVVVEGRPLAVVDPEPRAVGSVLLLPLRPIAEELGDRIAVDRREGTVEVVRAQDNTTIVLELSTGIVRVDGWAAGVVPDMPFADPDTLLLPQTAIEVLTGSHVKVEAGTRRIYVDLDRRLEGVRGPRADVWAEVAEEGFVAERLDLRLGNDSTNELRFRARFREFDLGLRYETPDFPTSGAYDPQWLALRVDSLRGYGFALGDANTARRELRGVDVARVRGLSFYRQGKEGGELRLVAGRPLSGSRRIDEERAVPEFDDLAVGGRYYSAGGSWEAGLSAFDGDAGTKAVGSFLHEWQPGKGRFRSHQEVDVGFFDLQGLDSEVDYRAQWNTSFRPTRAFSITSQTRYLGVGFRRPLLERDEDGDDDFDGIDNGVDPDVDGDGIANEDDPDFLTADARFDRLDFGLQLGYQPFSRLSLGARYQLRREGLFEEGTVAGTGSDGSGSDDGTGDGDGGATDGGTLLADAEDSTTVGATVTVQPFRAGPRLSVDYAVTDFESGPLAAGTVIDDPTGADGGEGTVLEGERRFLRLDLVQSLGRFQLLARHEEERGDREREITSLSLRPRPFQLPLGGGASLFLAPGLRGFKTDGQEYADLDLLTELRSGRLFGDRLDLRIGYARSLGLVDEVDGEPDSRVENQETLTATARLRLTESLALEASYVNDLRDDDDRFLVRLRAGLDFNPPRRYRLPNAGTGVLTGFTFLDRNQDGLYQPDEPELPGVGVRVRGRRLALRTSRQGRFTIQNLRAGPYQLEIDLDNLPLGLLPLEEQLPRLTVGDGGITHLDIPLIRSGQIRGCLFDDLDGDGILDPGEPGLEGVRLRLEPGGAETYTTFFGQFAFDRLRSDRYRLFVDPTYLPTAFLAPPPKEVEIGPGGEFLMMLEIPIERRPEDGEDSSREP